MLKSIIKAINKLFNKQKDIKNTYHNRLLKVERGQSFKGHAAELVLNDNILHLNNSYYSGNVIYIYDSKENNTKTIITHRFNTPKWLKDKLGVNWISSRDYQIDYTTVVGIDEWSVYFVRTTKDKGLYMGSHKENINILQYLTNNASKFRKYLKSLNSSQMHAMLHNIDVTVESDYSDLPF